MGVIQASFPRPLPQDLAAPSAEGSLLLASPEAVRCEWQVKCWVQGWPFLVLFAPEAPTTWLPRWERRPESSTQTHPLWFLTAWLHPPLPAGSPILSGWESVPPLGFCHSEPGLRSLPGVRRPLPNSSGAPLPAESLRSPGWIRCLSEGRAGGGRGGAGGR